MVQRRMLELSSPPVPPSCSPSLLLPLPGCFDGVVLGFAGLVVAGGFAGLDEVVGLGRSEGLEPPTGSPSSGPHAVVVRSTATAAAPRAYVFQALGLLRILRAAAFIVIPL
ncbi:hypothetical protein ACWFR1_38240 [Streptomyces sp. NPDC055103]